MTSINDRRNAELGSIVNKLILLMIPLLLITLQPCKTPLANEDVHLAPTREVDSLASPGPTLAEPIRHHSIKVVVSFGGEET